MGGEDEEHELVEAVAAFIHASRRAIRTNTLLRGLGERLPHEEECRPTDVASMLHLDELVGGQNVTHGRNVFALAGGTSALARLEQCGRGHGAAS